LAESRLANDASGRQLLLDMINDHLPQALVIHNQLIARNWLIEVVRGCAEQVGGMDALLRAVRIMQPNTLAYERILQLVGRSHVRDSSTPDP
jgi:Effector-associated domain 2